MEHYNGVMYNAMIPVNKPLIAKNALRYVSSCIRTGWISSAGTYIQTFEKNFASFVGVKHAITTTSGTAAIHLALASLGIAENDEVILPAHTMFSCAAAVIYTGARPVLVDVERDTWNMNCQTVEKKITKRTKVIMPVHIYGHPVDMDPLRSLAEKYKIQIVEDAAEACGAEYKGIRVGSIGTIGCFSFYANKIITTGEGGMMVTNDDRLAVHARTLKDLAHSHKRRFYHEEIGFNYRMTNMQAALGVAQLQEVHSYIEKKLWMANLYNKHLSHTEGLTLPVCKPWAKNVYWMYGVLVEDSFGMSRDQLQKKLREKGVETRTFFISLHRQPALRRLGYYKGEDNDYPVTDDISKRGLYLPSGLAIDEKQIMRVCRAITSLKKETRR